MRFPRKDAAYAICKLNDDLTELRSGWQCSASALEGGGHPALARFECGGDVLVTGLDGGSGWYPLTVQNTRLPLTFSRDTTARFKSQLTRAPDAVLHRVLLKSYGRPITEWYSYKELLQAIRAAVSGKPSHMHHRRGPV